MICWILVLKKVGIKLVLRLVLNYIIRKLEYLGFVSSFYSGFFVAGGSYASNGDDIFLRLPDAVQSAIVLDDVWLWFLQGTQLFSIPQVIRTTNDNIKKWLHLK